MADTNIFSQITPDIIRLAQKSESADIIDTELFTRYDVKRGLRDSNGKGILTGLTEISDVVAFKSVHGRKIPIDGQLYYQGYNVMNLVEGNKNEVEAEEVKLGDLRADEVSRLVRLNKYLNLLIHTDSVSIEKIKKIDQIMKED